MEVSVDAILQQKDWIVQAHVGHHVLHLKVDTGAQANLLPYSVYKKLQLRSRLRASNSVLRTYDGGIVKHLGIVTVKLALSTKATDIDFFVVKKGRQALLGLQASELLGLFSRSVNVVSTTTSEQVVKQFQEVFSGTGCLQRQYRMVLRDDAVPVIQPARRVPLALQGPLKQELDRMEKAGIVAKVQEPTDWFVPGKELVLADLLSRASVGPPDEEADEDVEIHAVTTVQALISEATQGQPIGRRPVPRRAASRSAASNEAPTPGPTKLALLLSIAGDDAPEVYNNFSFDQGEDRNDYATVIKKFDEYFAEQLNEVHERYVFRQRVQDEDSQRL
nr:uncharacterized protein LOC119178014 [Rhipicephalus microplus]